METSTCCCCTLICIAIICVVLEILSLGASVHYVIIFDESESGINGGESLRWLAAAIGAQVIFGISTAISIFLLLCCECFNSNIQKFFANVALSSIDLCALLLTVSGIFMALSAAEQPTSSGSMIYAGFISAVILLTSVVNICFTVTIHIIICIKV